MQVPGSKAGGPASQAIRGLILHGRSPEPHRPPRILPKAETPWCGFFVVQF
jgi:hypothetical protein